LIIARAIWEHNAGKPMRRLTLFNVLGRQPDSSTSRTLNTASSAYGLTKGGYNAEMLELTERGRAIVEQSDRKSLVEAALQPTVFRTFFEHYRDAVVPSKAASLDFLKSQGIAEGAAEICLAIILQNGQYVGLIQTISGKERVVSPQHAVENLGSLVNGTASLPVQINSPDSVEDSIDGDDPVLAPPRTAPQGTTSLQPSLHIDIQIHISSEASAEQIDQIFASMSKHLYGRN
jgi:hypothetical protein